MKIISSIKIVTEPFKTLRNETFARLYFAQIASLFGDAFTWLGLALLTYEINPDNAVAILASALTLRVTAYIIFSPFAGVVSERFQRKQILLITQFARMAIVCMLPFVNAEWQVYGLIFALNIFAAFFTPTYRAIIPQIVDKEIYREANGLSMATFQLLSVFGPALAGIVAVWLGAKQIFFVNGTTLLIAILFIITIPKAALQKGVDIADNTVPKKTWGEVLKGIRLLFGNKIVRFALSIEFISAIAGAMVLVNTVGLVKTSLQLDDKHYGWIMAVFGVGAAITAFLLGSLDKTKTRSISLISGAVFNWHSHKPCQFRSVHRIVVFMGFGRYRTNTCRYAIRNADRRKHTTPRPGQSIWSSFRIFSFMVGNSLSNSWFFRYKISR
ncbi:enterobactin exporter EntS [Sphingobacterium spiritivorum]|uniref:Enterobactin exporter EntS n=1 Tax=Sphingobacterium spiritivorum TaxID=258 RepID=A0A380CTF6_SPHSI|nr:MFS transporter [Sphingobacterium spiritivorum]SUJ28716.1 enterobactin exporter EntS [Sphingobacterium spiritivorum]